MFKFHSFVLYKLILLFWISNSAKFLHSKIVKIGRMLSTELKCKLLLKMNQESSEGFWKWYESSEDPEDCINPCQEWIIFRFPTLMWVNWVEGYSTFQEAGRRAFYKKQDHLQNPEAYSVSFCWVKSWNRKNPKDAEDPKEEF